MHANVHHRSPAKPDAPAHSACDTRFGWSARYGTSCPQERRPPACRPPKGKRAVKRPDAVLVNSGSIRLPTARFSYSGRKPSASIVSPGSRPCRPSARPASRLPQPSSRRICQATRNPLHPPHPAPTFRARSAAPPQSTPERSTCHFKKPSEFKYPDCLILRIHS